jgi:hypothetical protein
MRAVAGGAGLSEVVLGDRAPDVRAHQRTVGGAGGARLDARRIRDQVLTYKGYPYLAHIALPNFFFHAVTAYDILRHNGVELGKRDFIGTV